MEARAEEGRAAGRVIIWRCGRGVCWWCPACGEVHGVPLSGAPSWEFNGSMEKPTITPSVKISGSFGNPVTHGRVCHFHVEAGRIRYCGDCTHGLRDQTIDMVGRPET